MDIITRLNEFVSQRGLSSSQFADLLGIPRPSASQILSGRNTKISNEFLGKLHYAFPDLDLMWLMFGETSPFVATSRSEQTMSHEKSKISDSAPTLFDTQSNMSYIQDKNSLTDSESACEGVIDDLKNTATYLREINLSNHSTKVSSNEHSSVPPQKQQNLTDNSASQTNKHIDTVSNTFTAIKASQRIDSIIVYYNDKTFEVFKPE